jgi:hypothetical protein
MGTELAVKHVRRSYSKQFKSEVVAECKAAVQDLELRRRPPTPNSYLKSNSIVPKTENIVRAYSQ